MINLDTCPCTSEKNYAQCCGQYIEGHATASTAVALMRSRYSAYTLANIDYISITMQDQAAKNFDALDAKQWAQQCRWLGLRVVKTKQGTTTDDIGWVEFIARYQLDNKNHFIYERSEFNKIEGQWYYVSGENLTKTIQRNDPCPCGSDKKFKKCCGLTM